MDQPVKPFTSEAADTRRWIGRLIIAVLLGEAIWGLIVSVMNNVVVPWLGDVMGQSSGLPTSFTQRPYNYPELFVSVFEFCIAGLVAAVLNYFFQRAATSRGRTIKSSVVSAPAGPIRVVPQAVPTAVPTPTPPASGPFPSISPVPPQEPVAKLHPVFSPAPVAPATPVVAEPLIKSAVVVPPVPSVANPVVPPKPLPPAPKAEPAKPKKPKEVYYNIVGEPMPSDDD